MEQLSDFWQLVVEVWRHGVLGIDIGRILVAMAIFSLFVVLRSLFTRFVLSFAHVWTRRLSGDAGEGVLAALDGPIRFVPIVLGVFFSLEYLALEGTFETLAERATRSLIAFTIFWAFYRAVDPLSFLLNRLEEVFTPELVEWLVKAIKGAVVFLGGATILEIWGIQVGPILAGLGLFGVAVALGAQDMFKNLISGILIIMEQRFHKGDWVRVDGVVEGTVETIGFRSTVVRRFDRAPVYVPNTKLSDNAVTNFTKMTHRRIYWTIGVEYRTTLEQLKTIREGIEAFIIDDPDFAKPPSVPTFVRIDRFGESSIDIMVYCFTRTTNWGEWLAIKERLAFRIKEIVEGAGTGFAFPSRALYIETVPGERPEIFTPPGRKELADGASAEAQALPEPALPETTQKGTR